jgi:acetyltransferase-like isoleucine patch superfamily enzyme
MEQLIKLIRMCKESDSSLPMVILSHLYYKLRGKTIVANNRVIIKGLKNIKTGGLVHIGMSHIGFMHKYDRTLLNISGNLEFRSKCSIGKGCRFDIGTGAVARFGEGMMNANVNFIIMHGLQVGDGFLISWGCEFLDEDFHEIDFPGKKQKGNKIVIGDHVWIGANVTVLKGSRIPSGCVVASGSIVASAFDTENALIAGNPARIIKENVTWK